MEILGATEPGEYNSVLNFHSFPNLPSLSKEEGEGGDYDVLIQVLYSDVNPVDLQKLKNFKKPVHHNNNNNHHNFFVPGYGGSGIVMDVLGNQVNKSKYMGKHVCFLVDPSQFGQGSYATHVMVDVRCVAIIPDTNMIDMRDAACIPVAGLTAYESLIQLGLAAAPMKTTKTTTTTTTTATDTNSTRRSNSSSTTTTTTEPIDSTRLSIASAPDTTITASSGNNHESSSSTRQKTLLIIGGSGGVGSWAITLARVWHPHLNIIVTISSSSSSNKNPQEEWCLALGATKVIRHDEIETQLQGGREGSVDYVLCLTEPTMPVMDAMSNVITSYGHICLVVSGKGMESLNLSFCFFKCVTVHCQTVFSSIRTRYQHIVPAEELAVILSLLAKQSIRAPISPDLENNKVISEKFKHALEPNKGVLYALSQQQRGCRRGKFVLQIQGGDQIVFIDMKTTSLLSIPRRDCIQSKLLTLSKSKRPSTTGGDGTTSATTTSTTSWNEQASVLEKSQLISKLKHHPTLGLCKVADQQAKDYQDGLEMQEAENVKNIWGVQLKHREKNPPGQEVYFVDSKFGSIGEVSRKQCIASGIMTILAKNDNDDSKNNEIIQESIPEDERDEVLATIRQALKINLE